MKSECTQGCLKCGDDKMCDFCDYSNNYRMVDGYCEKFKVENCEFASSTGFCRLCKPNTYLDIVNGICLPIPESLRVTNCVYYAAPRLCSLCEPTFYLKGGDLCEVVASPIGNCEVHDASTCLECKPAFILSVDRLSCVADPGDNNCGMYSFIGCQECKPGYILNSNFYIELFYKINNAESNKQLGNMMYLSEQGGATYGNLRVCQKIKVDHCIEYENFQRCKTCSAGFFVENGDCALNPLDSINNCEKYSKIDQCIECSHGYYRQTSQKCVPVPKIEFCAEYDGRASKVMCLRCFREFYLAGENNCQRRSEQSQIEFCRQLMDDQEKCEDCIEGFSLTSDLKKCLPSIDECETYQLSTRKDSLLRCFRCEKGYYWDLASTVCLEGGIDHCEEYAVNEDKCAECEEGFFSKEHTCVRHQVLTNCVDYDKRRNICQQCEIGHFLFFQTNSCVEVQEIEHCEEYGSQMNCTRCEEGFYLEHDAYCSLIPTHLNCLEVDGDVCRKCVSDFLLINDKCFKAKMNVIDNCESSDLDGRRSEIKCEYCKENSLPLRYHDQYTCENMELLQVINPQVSHLTD